MTGTTSTIPVRLKWRNFQNGANPSFSTGEMVLLRAILAEEDGFDARVFADHVGVVKADDDSFRLTISDEGRAALADWRKRFEVAVEVEDHYDFDLKAEILSAVNQVLSGRGLRASAEIREAPALPKVVVSVSDGMASVSVDGAIDLLHVDLDREGEDVGPDDIESALRFERTEGVAADIDQAVNDARSTLEGYLERPVP
jgi:hypothetical protein